MQAASASAASMPGFSASASTAQLDQVADLAGRILGETRKAVIGKDETAELLLAAMLAGGHVLIEDVPGVGKTTLARAMAQAFGGSTRRIQFTPDLLPSDVTGITYFDQKAAEFRFRPGPIFANVVVADEINRATPRTQSALLEAMQEGNATIEGETHALPAPFLVVATQNPIELEGTFPLPEAQIDRFMMRLSMGYPIESDEIAMVTGAFDGGGPVATVGSPEEVEAARRATQAVYLSPEVAAYLAALVRATRTAPGVELGASPRASLALASAGRALAAMQGRTSVTPDDVKRLAPVVLEHRVVMTVEARLREQSPAGLIGELLRTTPVPVEGSVGLDGGS
jgi:MoxR-like ATPase